MFCLKLKQKTVRVKLLHNSRWLLSVVLIFVGLGFEEAQAGFKFKPDFIYGISAGFGNQTLNKDVTVEGDVYSLSRTEGPLMLGISIETFIHEKWSVALGHRRGGRMGPFSMGIGFSGFTVRRYFKNPAPFIPHKDMATSFVVRGWAPFAGFGTGVAHGSASREGEVVKTISSSGVYFGAHFGVDWQWKSNLILRPELFYNTTIMSDSTVPASMNEMGLLVGFHFRL